jgi:hypothetical protein
VRLAAADVAALPLAVALFDRDGAVLASSPEWRGGGLGTVVYRLPTASLAVACEEQDADVAELLTELLHAMQDAARASDGDQRRRLEVLGSSIALVAGIPHLTGGSTAEVLGNLKAVLATVSNYSVTVTRHTPGSVLDLALMTLALRQLVINARRHDDATEVTVAIDAGPTFTLQWHGLPAREGVTTSRHQGDRDRWGLGFVRLAMDALGGVYLAPGADDDGPVSAVLAIDPSPRLQLPLAALRDGVVVSASPAWDEETHAPPGSPLRPPWRQVVELAAASPDTIARDGSRRARTVGRTTWVAIPPEGTADRARDVIRGLDHERDLLDAPPPFATAIHGLAGVIALLLGDNPHRITPSAFDEQYPLAAAAVRAPALPGAFTGPAAPDPALVAVLASRLGGPLSNPDGRLRILIGDAHRSDPIALRLADARGVLSLP